MTSRSGSELAYMMIFKRHVLDNEPGASAVFAH
jgi:hypothetical protein